MLSTFSPEEGDSIQVVVVESEVGPSKDLLVSTFSLEAGDSTPAKAKGILVTLSTYEFLLVLIFWSKVLKKAFDLSDIFTEK